jgi:N-acetylglucosaminyl-diphospho-decaprenol L-rhamnosyltransferase
LKLFTIIVTYNAERWIERTLNSLSLLDVDNTAVVVDNQSSDNTLEIIKRQFSSVVVLPQEQNIGFGKGNNVGIDYALNQGADFVFLLNQDAYWNKGSIKNVLEQMLLDSQLALVSPIHLEGTATTLDFAFHSYVHPTKTNYLADSALKQQKFFYELPFVNAAAWIMKAEVIRKIGVFHPVFEHYGEDDEYCIRLKNNGYKLAICSESFILHDRPQQRANNKFFEPEVHLRRTLILEYFSNNHTPSADASQRFFKLMLYRLLTFKFGKFISGLQEFLKYKSIIKQLTIKQ